MTHLCSVQNLTIIYKGHQTPYPQDKGKLTPKAHQTQQSIKHKRCISRPLINSRRPYIGLPGTDRRPRIVRIQLLLNI